MIWIIAFAVFWVVCGVLAYGFVLAGFQAIWKHDQAEAEKVFPRNRKYALICACMGFFGFLTSAFMGDLKHRPMYRNPHKRSVSSNNEKD